MAAGCNRTGRFRANPRGWKFLGGGGTSPSPTYRKLPLATTNFATYNNANSRYYGRKVPYSVVNGVNVVPVIKINNATYGSGAGTVTPGHYALLMIAEATDAPTVAGINALDFTWCDGSDIGLETRSCFGVELTLPVGMFDTPAITSTSQLVVVGEYNEVIDINNTGDFMINLEPGFAEQYFE